MARWFSRALICSALVLSGLAILPAPSGSVTADEALSMTAPGQAGVGVLADPTYLPGLSVTADTSLSWSRASREWVQARATPTRHAARARRSAHTRAPAAVAANPVSAPVQVAPQAANPASAAPPASPNGPTSWPALNQAIARIPSYRPMVAQWIITNANGWGAADMHNNIIYISPDVPANRLYDVAVHEWSHILSVVDYQGDVGRALDAMNAYYQTSGMYGAEIAADCMAIEQGAQWTHYTQCTYSPWRTGARRLVAGEKL